MRTILITVCLVPLFTNSAIVCAQNTDRRDPPKTGDDTGNRQVKIRKIFGEGSRGYWGEVVKIDEKEMHVRCVYSGDEKTPKVRVFRPIDVLANGEVIEHAWDGDTYRWQEIKKGDAVEVNTVPDLDEKVDYCITIRLERRPGGKIPESQRPSKIIVPHHVRANVLNDIDNGLNVSEDEIRKAFPYTPDPEAVNATPPTDELPADYRKKLDEIRAKKAKEKDLKAKSTTDKADPKKDDKK